MGVFNQLKHNYTANGLTIGTKILIRTQELDPIYEENSCFYIFSKETNEKIGNRLGSNPLMFPINKLEAVDIDNMEDLYLAEFLLQKGYEQELIKEQLLFI